MKFFMIWNRKTQEWMSNRRWSRSGGPRKSIPRAYTTKAAALLGRRGFLGEPDVHKDDLVIVEFAGFPVNPPPCLTGEGVR